MVIKDAEVRAEIDAELLSRPPIKVKPPATILHQAFLVTGIEDSERLHHWMEQAFNIPKPQADIRQLIHDIPDGVFKWERHGEFETITLVLWEQDQHMQPHEVGSGEGLPDRISASQIRLFPMMDLVKTGGAPSSAVASHLIGEDAVCFANYPPTTEGFTQFDVYLNSMPPDRAGRLAQRLLEIETYRYMAMMAVPLARGAQTELRALNMGLDDLISELHEGDGLAVNQELLIRIQGFIQESAQLRARTGFRFSATKAYYAIVLKRLTEIRETRLAGSSRLGTFLTRRMQPAIDLCFAMEQQITALDTRLEQASQILRTKVDLGLAQQNQSLLEEIRRSAKTQLIMQRSVEGFSVVAISYYLVSLLAIFLKGGEKAGWFTGWEIYEAILAPIAILFVIYRLRQVLHHSSSETATTEET